MRQIRFSVYGPKKGYFDCPLDHWWFEPYGFVYAGNICLEPGFVGVKEILSRIFADGNGEGDGPGFTVGDRPMSMGDIVHLENQGCWLRVVDDWAGLDSDGGHGLPFLREGEVWACC